MKLIIIAATVAILATTILGATFPEGASVCFLPTSCKLSHMTFNGTIRSIPHSGDGTVQEIYEQFKSANPGVAEIAENQIAVRDVNELAPRNKVERLQANILLFIKY